jgi:hypothetical protein
MANEMANEIDRCDIDPPSNPFAPLGIATARQLAGYLSMSMDEIGYLAGSYAEYVSSVLNGRIVSATARQICKRVDEIGKFPIGATWRFAVWKKYERDQANRRRAGSGR